MRERANAPNAPVTLSPPRAAPHARTHEAEAGLSGDGVVGAGSAAHAELLLLLVRVGFGFGFGFGLGLGLGLGLGSGLRLG